MLFNSLAFLIFFPVVFILYYIIPHKFRWVLLLVASLGFYMWWKAELVVLILFSAFSNFLIACMIADSKSHKSRKILLISGLVINFSLLFVFKYLPFSSETFATLTGKGQRFDIILPIGISFYTFQAAGYIIDVYRGRLGAQRNYLKLLLFITFFPQLVAGPIERAENLMPQLFKKKKLKYSNISEGAKIMLWGFFKKLVIADRAAFFVNGVFNSAEYYSFLPYLIATILFAFQLYCDFSGYSDIAMGCAKILGIDLMRNFNRPYLATNIKDFWRRWHVSLSGWFKDYLYFPMGGSRVSKLRKYLNLMVTFIISGIWHGANWTFVAWGFLNGAFQVVGSIKNDIIKIKKKPLILKMLGVLFTFSLYAFSLIFFRAGSIGDAIYIITHFFWGFKDTLTPQGLYNAINTLPATIFELFVVLGAILFLMITELFETKEPIYRLIDKKPVIKFLFYFVVIVAIFGLGVFSNGGEFIYFQF